MLYEISWREHCSCNNTLGGGGEQVYAFDPLLYTHGMKMNAFNRFTYSLHVKAFILSLSCYLPFQYQPHVELHVSC